MRDDEHAAIMTAGLNTRQVLSCDQLVKGNQILLFGGFQIIDNEGTDITGKFTPLLKELFLLIFGIDN